MKVLLVSEYFPPKIFGGGEISAWQIAEALAKKIDVQVLTSCFPSRSLEIKNNVKIHRKFKTGENPYSFKSNLKRSFIFPRSCREEIVKLDKKEDFDIIHCLNINSMMGVSKIEKPVIAHINAPMLFCPVGTKFVDRLCNVKCNFFKFMRCYCRIGKISKVKQNFILRFNPLFPIFVYHRFNSRKKKLGEIDHFIAISSYMKKLLLQEGIPDESISVVPNPVDMEKFSCKKSKGGRVKILYIGSYEKFKGVDILLSALLDLNKEFEANFYGSGSLRDYLIRRTDNRIKIYDEIPYDNTPQVYQNSDIVVFPSLIGEAFGRVIIEAMASGKAVIATNVGGVPDIIDNGINGILIEPNKQELAKALTKLIEDDKLRERLGKNARKTALERYNKDKIAENLIEIYLSFTGGD